MAKIQFIDSQFKELGRPTTKQIRQACTTKEQLNVRAYGRMLKLEVIKEAPSKKNQKAWVIRLIGHDKPDQKLTYSTVKERWELTELTRNIAENL